MIWLALLKRFWRLLAGVIVILALLWAVHHRGYLAGVRDERAAWIPRLVEAEKARAEADAKTAAIEAAQTVTTANAEARHAATVQALNTRAADADRRIRTLSVRLASANTGRCEVRTVSDPAAEPHDPAASESSAERAGIRIADVGRRCESDAFTLMELQDWIRQLTSLRTGP